MSSRVELESRIRFSEPRRRYQNGSGWISRAQVQGEGREHIESERAWDAAIREEARLHELMPTGYEWNGCDPFTVDRGEIVVRLVGRLKDSAVGEVEKK